MSDPPSPSTKPFLQAVILALLTLGFFASWPLMALYVAKNETPPFPANRDIHCASCKEVCERSRLLCRRLACYEYDGNARVSRS